MVFVWAHSMASQGLSDEYWQSRDDSLMYSISRLAKDGHDVSIVTFTERREPIAYNRDGCQILLFPVDVPGQPFGDQTSRSLLANLRKDPPDIVYLNSLNMVMNRIILDGVSGPRFILRAHGKIIHDFLVEDVDALEVSNEMQRREATETFLIEREKVWINPFGADTTLFTPKPGVSKDYDVIYFGRIVKGKNIELLLRTFQKIEGRFLLIGKGPHDGHYRNMASKLGVGNKAVFHGWVDSSELPDFLNRSKVFVLPSLSEGGGRAVSEAMACGLPVIAMRGARGSEAYIEHGRSGLVTKPGDLVEAITRILSDETLRREFGKRGRELCVSRFSSEAFYQRLKKLTEFLETRKPIEKPIQRRPIFYVKRLLKTNYWIARLRNSKAKRVARKYRA